MAVSRPGYIYSSADFGPEEVEFQRLFRLQRDDARNYFLTVTKPRLDRSYKLYIAYGGDRQMEIQRWQSNVQIPYIQSVIETMVPRIIDARPDFTVRARKDKDQPKCEKQQNLMDYFWENAKMDVTTEDFVRATLIYGTGFLQVSWKKDVRKLKFLKTKDIGNKKYMWETREQVFFDAPYCEWIDNYTLWYDWHNTDRKSKQFWFKRLVLTEAEIRRRYPMADKDRLQLAINSPGGDLIDYAAIRQQVRTTFLYTTKNSMASMMSASGTVYGTDKYYSTQDNTLKMYEVYEWIRPFDDSYSVLVGGSYVPIFKDAAMPIPYDFKETPFIEATYLKIPGEFEGYGLPLILESPQIMLNLIKNQRLDAATLSIHKMWVVNPLANINKDELVTRPFGIIYSIDPNGVREIQFSDIKMSSYKEEELLKNDMQYASGVDDFSQGVGGGAGSATEVRHLRESTLERVRLFVNHLGAAYSDVMRYWISMQRQLFSETMSVRVIGDDGREQFPLIEKDDLIGMFDYKASVLPSIAGQDDVNKKQDMDLFQLLVNLPFVDPQKLTAKLLPDFGWSLDMVAKQDSGQQPQMGPDGQPMPGGTQAPGGPGMPPGAPQGAPQGMPPGMPPGGPQGAPQGMPPGMPQAAGGMGGPGFPTQQHSMNFSPGMQRAMSLLKQTGNTGQPDITPFAQLSSPLNLLDTGSMPPTAPGIPNNSGFNRSPGAKVDTNIPNASRTQSTHGNILAKAIALQSRKK